MRGDVQLSKGQYALSQKAIILRRTSEEDPAPLSASETGAAKPDAKVLRPPTSTEVAKDSEALSTAVAPPAEPAKVDATTAAEARDIESGGVEMKSCDPAASEAPTAEPVAVGAAPGSDDVVEVATGLKKGGDEAAAWRDMPEIFLFWARNRRRAGNLVVCPNETSMNRLVQAYLVCEVVEHTVAT